MIGPIVQSLATAWLRAAGAAGVAGALAIPRTSAEATSLAAVIIDHSFAKFCYNV
jgi:hypothetical protein